MRSQGEEKRDNSVGGVMSIQSKEQSMSDEQTFGQRLSALSFNQVETMLIWQCKQFATVIDRMNQLRASNDNADIEAYGFHSLS